MSVEYTIVCDGCGAVLAASRTSVHHARTEVRAAGGRAPLPSSGLDLCPECVKAGRKV